MITLLFLALFAALAVPLLDGDWRTGLVVTVAIGFLQDPLRKLLPGQPSTYSGMVLLAFVLCLMVMLGKANGQLGLRAMFWTAPAMLDWIPLYLGLIAAQTLNSFLRFGDPRLALLGASFYLAPAVALWVGYQIGLNPQALKKLIVVYLLFCTLFAITAFLDFLGVVDPLMQEVGSGILITFEGYSAQGISGFWRTSEVAGWHLAAGACFSIILAAASPRRENQVGLLLLAAALSYLTITTGRRKSLIMVLAFTAIFLLLFSRKATPASREQVISSIFGSAAMAYATYAMFLISAKGDSFTTYLNRALTSTDDIGERFNSQGIGALTRGLEISQGFGLGVGAGANLGNLQISADAQALRGGIQSLAYVSEGGGGRIVSELGLPGVIIGGSVALIFITALWNNFHLLERLPQQVAYLLLGLIAFGIANVFFFFSASQVYSDPFILIILGVCLGSFLAVPSLVVWQQRTQAYSTSPR